MAKRISIVQLEEDSGMTRDELVEESADSTVCPALCSEDCEVELDGYCEHGFPSLYVAMGLI